MKIQIKKGLIIREPKTLALLECEKTYIVERSQFWIRRLKAGDAVLVTDKPVLKKKTKKIIEKIESQDSEEKGE